MLERHKENLISIIPSFAGEIAQSLKDNLPEKSYTTKLFKEGEDRIIQKVGEEAIETIIAAKGGKKNEIINAATAKAMPTP